MTFDVVGTSYNRFMGRYSEPLADRHVDWLSPQPGQRALDVGCGPGALTARLVDALGAGAVSAIDPSEPFVAAARDRLPDVDVRQAPAERIPFDDNTFDHTAAQLVLHFTKDPVVALTEMARVTRQGGWVSATVWDFADHRAPPSPFWRAVRRLDPSAVAEDHLAGARDGDLARYAVAAGLDDVEPMELGVTVHHPTFEQWWEPYTLGVGPAGDYVARLDYAARQELRDTCRSILPEAPFDVTAVAWAVRGRA